MLGSVPSTAVRVNEEPVATQHWERWAEEAKQGGFGPWKEECAPLGKLRLEKGIARLPTVIYLQILNLPIFFFLIFENFNPDNPLKIKFGIVCRYVLCVCMQGWARKTVSKASTPHSRNWSHRWFWVPWCTDARNRAWLLSNSINCSAISPSPDLIALSSTLPAVMVVDPLVTSSSGIEIVTSAKNRRDGHPSSVPSHPPPTSPTPPAVILPDQ